MVAHAALLKAALVRRLGLALLALVPCLTSVGFHLKGATPSPQKAAEERPALAFDQYAVHLGPITPMSLARGWFRFTNFSDRPVKITELKTSCGCLKPHLEKREYAPGETGQFFVHVSTAGEQPGPREYTITVDYEDPEPQSVDLTFSMVLPPKQVYISPRALLLYVFGEESTEREVVISDNRDRPCKVTAVETSAEFLTARIGEVDIDNEGVQKTVIKVNVAPVALGRHQAVVRVRTDDPRFPAITVPVHVHRQATLPAEFSSKQK